MTGPAPDESGSVPGSPGRPDPEPTPPSYEQSTSEHPAPQGAAASAIAPGAVDGTSGSAGNPDEQAASWQAALDDALNEFGDAPRQPHSGRPASNGPSAGGSTAESGAPVDHDHDDDQQGRRRAGLLASLTALSTRMMSERAVRATEAAAAAATASAQAAETAAAGGESGSHPYHSPFNWGFFGGLGVLIAYVTYLMLDTIRDTLILLAIATLLSIGLDPLVSLLERNGLRRGGAVATVFLALLAVIAAAIYAIVPPIVNEVGSFVGSVPQLIESLQENPTIQNLDQRFQLLDALRNSNIVQNVGSGAAGGLLTASVTVASVFLDLVIILILTLYFLAGFPRIKAAAYRLVPATRRPRVVELSDRVLKQMGGYLSGATIIAIQAGLIAGIFAFIIGLPYPWAIALGAAVLDFIPVVGPIIIGVSMTLLGFTQSLAIGIIAGVFYLCQHLFEAYWLYPRVMRRTVEISTGAVVVAILIGASLLGVTGAILAVPVAAAIMLIVREVIMPMQERS
jgi:predicted PurR-regulated permease PerM